MRVAILLTASVALMASPCFASSNLPRLLGTDADSLSWPSSLAVSYPLPELSHWFIWLWQLVAHTLANVVTEVKMSLDFDAAFAVNSSHAEALDMTGCVITAGIIASLFLCIATVGYGFWLSVREK